MAFLPVLTTVVGVSMSFGYFVQTFKIFHRKSAKDVSLTTYLIFSFGIATWLTYGISITDWPLIISNLAAIIGSLSVILAWLIYGRVSSGE